MLLHGLYNMVNSISTKELDFTVAVKSKSYCRAKKTPTVVVGAATKGSQNKGSVVEVSMFILFSGDESICSWSKVTTLSRENNTEFEGNAKSERSFKGGGSGGTSCGNWTLAGEVREAAWSARSALSSKDGFLLEVLKSSKFGREIKTSVESGRLSRGTPGQPESGARGD